MNEKRMPISGHLIELRSRLLACIVATLLMMIVAYIFYLDVFLPMIRAPLDAIEGEAATNPFVLEHPLLQKMSDYYHAKVREAANGKPTPEQLAPVRLKYTGLIVPLVVRLKVSLIIGVLLALPIILFEIWSFVSSGLYKHERRYVLVYGPASLFLFVLGAAVAYFLILPIGVVVLLLSGVEQNMDAILTANEYAPFVMWLLLGFGIIFQMPLVVLFLTKLGILGPEKLRKSRRYAILIMVIVAALITPPDPFTQIAMAIPMYALYEASIILSRMAVRKREVWGE